MATEDRVKVLEGEFKLIKSELRQTLGSVRDFLLDLKLPPMQEEPGLQKETATGQGANPETPPEPENNESGNANDSGFGNNGSDNGMPQSQDQMPDFSNLGQPQDGQPAADEMSAEEPATEALPPLDFDSSEDDEMSSGDMPGLTNDTKDEPSESDEEDSQDEDAALEGQAQNQGQSDQYRSSIPQVNMLANIIRWVSMAKKEIGSAQLPVFLDVYATTGSLVPEMKDIILHLAEVATNPGLSDETPENGQIINEQLKLCMDINRSSGQLPDDIKFKIQRLTELLLQQSIYYNKADVWSKLLVDLHGILTGGGATLRSLQSLSPSEIKLPAGSDDLENDVDEDEEAADLKFAQDIPDDHEAEKIIYEEPPRMDPNMLRGTRPARLRLIMPVGDGQEQELDLGNLFISTDSKPKPGSSPKKSASKRK